MTQALKIATNLQLQGLVAIKISLEVSAVNLKEKPDVINLKLYGVDIKCYHIPDDELSKER